MVEPLLAFAFLRANTELAFLGCVHTLGFETILFFLAPDVHLYFRTILPPERLHICTTPSV
jgi:hypothetical protein